MWTSSVCFLCLKSFNFNKVAPDSPDENLRLKFQAINSKRLALFFERFLKLPQESPLISTLCSKGQQKQSSPGTSSSFLDQFCSGCLEILDGTLQLYNELCEVQLKMAWSLGQWESLLKVDEKSKPKPSSKLTSLLQQKLSKQLEPSLGIRDTEEVWKMRSFILSHCTKARNEMLDHRKLDVTLDRCSVPFPVASNDCGTTTTSFIVLDTNPSLSNDVHEDDVVVKRELDDQEFESADMEDTASMDFEADVDFPNTNPKQEPNAASSSTEHVAVARLRRSAKNNNFCYFPKTKQPKKVKVEKDKLKKQRVKVPVDGEGYPCQLCGRTWATLKILRRHLYAHVDKRFGMSRRPAPTFQCRFCWASFIFEQQRWIHEQIGTHDNKMTSMKFTCFEDACNGNPPFSTFDDLEAHFESVHRKPNESVHKCSICQWPFTSDDMRQIHELIHVHYTDYNMTSTGKLAKIFKCPNCEGQTFSNFSSMKTHFISEHTNIDDGRIHKCHKCSNSYSRLFSLEDHLKTHEMEDHLANPEEAVAGSSNTSTYHVCEECGKPCATSRILADHKTKVHKKVQCTLCGKMIIRIRFSRHMRYAHNDGTGPQYQCPICNKVFLGKEKLKRHVEKIHPDGKEWEGEVCHICSKKYQRRGLLHRHLRIAHQIEAEEMKRPAKYFCPHCGMGYYYVCSLNNHIDSKHRRPEERKFHFPCALCSKTFWRKSVLKKHLEEAHGQGQVEVKVQQND